MPSRANQYRHKPTPSARPRPKTAARGYGGRWQRFRKAFLADRPVCEGECARQGRVVAAEHVHHIDLLGPNGPRGYDPTNLQPLCESCHNRLTGQTKGK